MADRFSGSWFRRSGQLTLVAITLAIAACGSAGSQGTIGSAIGAGTVAPLEGSPEQTAIDMRAAEWRAAPIEGSPEQAAIELGR
jgi:hypothetical protein